MTSLGKILRATVGIIGLGLMASCSTSGDSIDKNTIQKIKNGYSFKDRTGQKKYSVDLNNGSLNVVYTIKDRSLTDIETETIGLNDSTDKASLISDDALQYAVDIADAEEVETKQEVVLEKYKNGRPMLTAVATAVFNSSGKAVLADTVLLIDNKNPQNIATLNEKTQLKIRQAFSLQVE